MNKALARYFGLFFILSFLSYGVGSGLMEIIQIENLLPGHILAQKTEIMTGGILISVFHTLFNVGLLVIMFNILKPFNKNVSYFYLITGLISTLMLAFGAVCLLTYIPVSVQFNGVDTDNILLFSSMISLVTKLNFYAYQAGMAIWGFGGLCLCYLLYQSRLVSLAFPIWGYFGYSIFIAGTILELFGFPVGLILSVPGGLFEIGLSVWLIIKGFDKELVTGK